MLSFPTVTLEGLGCIPLTSSSLLPACSGDVTYRRLVQKERPDRQYSKETVSLTSGTTGRLGHSGKGLLVWRNCLERVSEWVLFTSRKYHETNKRDFGRMSQMVRCNKWTKLEKSFAWCRVLKCYVFMFTSVWQLGKLKYIWYCFVLFISLRGTVKCSSLMELILLFSGYFKHVWISFLAVIVFSWLYEKNSKRF